MVEYRQTYQLYHVVCSTRIDSLPFLKTCLLAAELSYQWWSLYWSVPNAAVDKRIIVIRALFSSCVMSLLVLWNGAALGQGLSLASLPTTLDAAMVDVQAGKADQAYETLLRYEAQFAGLPQFDYALGVAALESGNAGYAVFALQRSIAMDSANAGAVMDLGKAYYQLGDYDESESSFNQVLALDPPSNVGGIARQYLASIKRIRQGAVSRFKFNSSVDIGGGYDSNANSAPTIDSYLQTPLSEESQQSPSSFSSVDISLSALYSLDKQVSLNSQIKYAKKDYADVTFVNTEMMNVSTGFQLVEDNNVLSMNLSRMQSKVAGELAGTNTGLMMQWFRSVNKKHSVALFSQYAMLRNAPAKIPIK
jgi:tetratricopeptide (TPR) repeat protein